MQEQTPPPFSGQGNLSLTKSSELPSENNVPTPAFSQVRRFKFHGDAMEYFGIWIVNILLTIVTLSLYAPWAKVRRLRYFYGNTEFFRRRFDFTGVPKKILIGRLIALGIYGAISAISQYSLTATLIGFIVLYLAVPWLIRATLRFTARNSKYANSRFYFAGTSKEAYKVFLKCIAIYIISLGLFYPVLIWLYKRYCIDHLYAGQLKFKLQADWPDYMRAVYIPTFMFIGIILVAAMIGGVLGSLSRPEVFAGVLGVAYIVGGLFVFPLMSARIFITTWNNTVIGNSKFATDCNQWRFAWIVGTNWIVKILSLGLMSAWAAIRIYRYKVDSLSLTLLDDPDQMMNLAQADHSALAEEISDIFDIDVSL
ncbi:YjgN family protein [Acinetobacter sp. Marseille-Q1623]|uniref:YjgN family protein n=1 Tax=Acinetobacter sp. Marseille-Q1623 TaxID=2697501 RepID=UPI00157A6A23|nr:YjgN family protein [Acinetobacter sp. Marseille-Q1623]